MLQLLLAVTSAQILNLGVGMSLWAGAEARKGTRPNKYPLTSVGMLLEFKYSSVGAAEASAAVMDRPKLYTITLWPLTCVPSSHILALGFADFPSGDGTSESAGQGAACINKRNRKKKKFTPWARQPCLMGGLG